MNKIYRIEITTTAEVEAEEAIRWLKQYSSDTAKRFSEGLIKAVESLQKKSASLCVGS